jgi:hypothetical protein
MAVEALGLYFSAGCRGVRRLDCSTVHNDAQPISANLTHRVYSSRRSSRRWLTSFRGHARKVETQALKEPCLLRFLGFLFRGAGFDLPLALDFPLGFPLCFPLWLGLPFPFRGALASPCNEIFIA